MQGMEGRDSSIECRRHHDRRCCGGNSVAAPQWQWQLGCGGSGSKAVVTAVGGNQKEENLTVGNEKSLIRTGK